MNFKFSFFFFFYQISHAMSRTKMMDHIISCCISDGVYSFLFRAVSKASHSIVAELRAAELWIICPTCFYWWQLLPNGACCWRLPPTAAAVWLLLWPTGIRSAIKMVFQPENEQHLDWIHAKLAASGLPGVVHVRCCVFVPDWKWSLIILMLIRVMKPNPAHSLTFKHSCVCSWISGLPVHLS